MADQSTTDLKYGHFGQIIYNPEDQVWLFPRNLESSSTLQPLGTSQLVFKSQRPQSRPDPVTTDKPSVQLNRQLAELLRFDPTIAPSAHLLIEPAVVSQEIQKTVIRHDPTAGHLLAFGRVPDQTIKRSMPIVAFPAADHAHILRLIQVQPQKHGWERNKSVWIDVPRISGESGTWHAPQPIRQICFADADEDSNLARTLAVRTTIAVHILRVGARKHASSWNSLTSSPSRFHTDQLCTLNLDLFGGLAPAHVAFNHRYPKQFITVDQHGTWHVWDSSLKQIPSEHGKPIELYRGAINDSLISDEETTASLLDDGWGRAIWAGNVQTIITASRRCLGIYDIQAKPVRLQSPDLGIAGTPYWVLDIMLNPLDPTLVFVLTSTSLFCLRVRCLDEFDPESYSTAGAEIVLQCRHFRDPEDTGLGLSNFVDITGMSNTFLDIRAAMLTFHYRCRCVY
jgi:RNA polymerase I-specific transcription initiation factor RRN6